MWASFIWEIEKFCTPSRETADGAVGGSECQEEPPNKENEKKKEYFFSQHLTGNSISSYILVYKKETKVAISLTNLVIGPFPIPLPNPKYHFYKHHRAISSNTFLESSLQSVRVYLILSGNEHSALPGVEFFRRLF